MTHDGIGKYLSEVVEKAPGETDDVVGILKETQGRRRRQLPAGRLRGGDEVVRRADPRRRLRDGELHAGLPRPRAVLGRRFEQAGVPIIGDDIKSQVGATITHRVLTTLFRDRGVRLDKTMQLNVGGNSDFLNMLERERLESKKISKTNAVTSMLDYDIGADNVHVGPSDYVPWLTDRKWAYIRMEGTTFGNVPLNVELKLEVWDSPNSAGIVIDAVRLAKLALNNGIAGRARGTELVPDEVAAEADPRRRRARADRAVHQATTSARRRRRPGEGLSIRRRAPPNRPATAGLFSFYAGEVRLRVCLVTPFSWSQPHEVNEHVDGVAAELRGSGTRSPCSRRRTVPSTSGRAVARSNASCCPTWSRSARRCRSRAGRGWACRWACGRT